MKTIVLFSGGLDSTTVLAMELAAGNDVLALTVDYNQSNYDEIKRCRQLAEMWGFPHKVIQVDLERRDARAEIPARNTVFLAKALEYALIEGVHRIAYGAEPDATYTDSSLEYIGAMRSVMALHGVELTAPIRNWKGKKEVLIKALDLGVPLDLIHSSRTNMVNGACKASARFLKTLYSLFPAVNPIRLLTVIADAHAASNLNPFDLKTPQTGSFKWLPALFTLAAMKAPVDDFQVHTTGNWGRSLMIANRWLKRSADITIHHTDEIEELKSNKVNTDSIEAQWGMKQALSRLPRPRYLDAGLAFRVTQGHLRQAVLSLGYKEDQENGLPLITE